MTGVVGIGLLSSLLMGDVPLHGQVDEKWALDERSRDESNGSQRETDGEQELQALHP